MLNYIGFTITQVRILGLQKHKSGWGSRYRGQEYPVFLTDCAISYQDHLENANIFRSTSLGGGQETHATVY